MTRRILNIVPVPVPPAALDAFRAQLSDEVVHPDFENDFVAARAGARVIDSPYEQLLAETFVLEAGARAQEQGYDAVAINSMSDSALSALRSRLEIPVVAPASASILLACLLGKKFSIITMWPRWHSLYEKTIAEQGLAHRVASIRDIGVRPDAAELLAGKEEVVFELLERQARAAIDEDGADVIILGSTTMHQSYEHLRTVLEVPVLNPGVVAEKFAELLVLTGVSHSKKAYPSPEVVQDDLLDAVRSVR
ncbi:aspartate/glutamate racemase family protein [Microbacterium sp. HA-8]|uniref:aspartate/glutamate racemase family protein n=1 Tax=unclassified Microbacterium TaxID=2609290 RepID=UPI000C2BC104|nr:aspartate/glutamate racemase family protein [Microbacterium sp. BR1]